MTCFKMRQFFFILICLSLFASISACSTAANTNVTNSSNRPVIASTNPSTTAATPSISSTPISSVSTNCPATGTARAAVMPSLQLGKNQSLVFSDHNGNLATFKRYDVQTKMTTTILNPIAEIIRSAQLSSDGQWILFSVEDLNNISKIQLIRVDGQYLQTLYCAPIGKQIDPLGATGIQWSPNQKQIIFPQSGNQNQPSLYLLNVTNGNIQMELSLPTPYPYSSIEPRAWMDSTRIYVVSQQSYIFILDTSKGPNQNVSDLHLVTTLGSLQNHPEFDSSSDGTKLIEGGCSSSLCQLWSGPSIGGSMKMVLNSNTIPFFSLRFIGYSPTSLLLSIPSNSQGSNVGFWRINADGTGLVRLNNVSGGFNPFTQYPWSNFSRNGLLYSENNYFGSLNGGPLTQYSDDPDTTVVIGWTTM